MFFGALLLVFLAPLPVFAADILSILAEVTRLLGLIIPIIFGLAFIVFLWGMFQYIRAADEGGKEEGRNKIIYGIIGLFVMVAVWGLVKVVQETFLGSTSLIAPTNVPKFPGQSGSSACGPSGCP